MKDKVRYFVSKIESYEALVANSLEQRGAFLNSLRPMSDYLASITEQLTGNNLLAIELAKDLYDTAQALDDISKTEFIAKRLAFLNKLATNVPITAEHRKALDQLALRADNAGLAYLANRQNLVDLQMEIFGNASVGNYDIKNSDQMSKLARELAIRAIAAEEARAITKKFVPSYNSTDSQFAFEDDNSGNRKFELWLNKDLWRKYLASEKVWGANYISLSEENPTILEKIKLFLKMKVEQLELPETKEFIGLSDDKVAEQAGRGNDAAALELAKRTTARLGSIVGDDTKIEDAEIVRLTYGFKKVFTTMMGNYFKEILAFRIIPSGKKWDALYSKAKGSARALFYTEIEAWASGKITDNQGNAPKILDGSALDPKLRGIVDQQLKIFSNSAAGIRCSELELLK
jgi:hypothetical protein